MSYAKPNRLHVNHEETTVGFSFGAVYSVLPIHFCNGQPHIEARFVGGTRLSFTPAAFTDLLREGMEALAKLPVMPDVHDAVGEELV